MLVRLRISNFAIIKHLEINLKTGLHILSGETGAGKSIIINAVNLILGSRASSDLIRSGSEEATVEALFTFPDNPPLKGLLAEFDVPFETELLIKRTISREGRNRININGSMTTLQMLSRIGSTLISISGQHEHQRLLSPEHHLLLLDDFGALSDARQALTANFSEYGTLCSAIRKIEKEIQAAEERQELARFQIQEIQEAGISAGEDDVLALEKRRLQHAEELWQTVSETVERLYEGNESVFSHLSQVLKMLEKAARIDGTLDAAADTLRDTQARIEDTSFSLRAFRSEIRADPHRLEEVDSRLQLLSRLKRKYGPGLDDVLRVKDTLSQAVEDLDGKKEEMEGLCRERERMVSDLLERARALSRKRREAARRLESSVERELGQLNMPGTRFEVRFQEEAPGDTAHEIDSLRPEGLDRAEFMIAPNVGETLKPLSKIASGGELSRFMLAMKTILAGTGGVETIVFDEVDSGIGGSTAEVVGEKLCTLSDHHQILCITHLPQIASKGMNHFLVKKDVVGRRTEVRIRELDPEARVQEIARLMGGREITAQALAYAGEMLGYGLK